MTDAVIDTANDDERPPNPMALLAYAIENAIDATEAMLAKRGLYSDRARIRARLLSPDNEQTLLDALRQAQSDA